VLNYIESEKVGGVTVTQTGCIGLCEQEPILQVVLGDQPKVVFCTTENDVAHIARALHAGANEYIMKPFDKDIIADKFQEVGLVARPEAAPL